MSNNNNNNNSINKLNKYKYPGAKRLMLEAQELKDNTEDYCAQPIDDNLFVLLILSIINTYAHQFEWHFTLRGPPDTAFDGGYYHGRLSFPTEYPMKPPSIILLTPNGRFETNKKICLSISGFHPETWQPSWSVRTALLALIAFMPTKANSAIGSLDYSDAERRRLALKSRCWSCETCGLIKDLLVPPGGTSIHHQLARPKGAELVEAAKPGTSRQVSEGSESDSNSSEPSDEQQRNFSINYNNSDNSNIEPTSSRQQQQVSLDSPSNLLTNQVPQHQRQNLASKSASNNTEAQHNNSISNTQVTPVRSPLVLKSIFMLLFLLILRRIVMLVQP